MKFNYIFDEIGLQQLALIPELWNVYMFDLSEVVVGDHEDGHADDEPDAVGVLGPEEALGTLER